jgi:hypothetical protein
MLLKNGKWTRWLLIVVCHEWIYFIVLVDNPTCFSPMLIFICQQTQQPTFQNMKSNVGKQSLKWGDRLTEAGAQFGTDDLAQLGFKQDKDQAD